MFSKEQTDCHAIARNDDRIKRLTTPNPSQRGIPEMSKLIYVTLRPNIFHINQYEMTLICDK